MAPLTRPKWHEAYDAQMGLWRWERTVEGVEFLTSYYRVNAAAFERPDSTGNLLRQLCQSELGRLTDCDPIFVSDEMCEVVKAAAPMFDPEPLLETDLITPHGFLYFETPFEIRSRFDEPTTIKAASWVMQYTFEKDLSNEQRVQLEDARFGTAVESIDDVESLVKSWGGTVSGIALTLYAVNDNFPSIASDLLPMHLTPWYFGMTFDGNEWDLEGLPTGAEWWWRIIQTTFRLMQQQIAVRRRELPPRSARREAARAGYPEREVVVVRLRREQSAGHHDEALSEANYSHRFIVSGHWRNQWYPSIGMHRQIWISPYVKGPEELPLIVRPRRVFQWDK